MGANGTGIQVLDNASPTLLNNIVAGLATGINVAADSNSTVVGGTVYQSNTTNTAGTGVGSFPLVLGPTAPLFVDAANGNFYLQQGSLAIDSSINSLGDRPEMTTVRDPLGIPPSSILAPDTDLLGQTRADDPKVPPPPGLGSNVFKDRGAIDRIDFAAPIAQLTNPLDNDSSGHDRDPANNDVIIAGEIVSYFAVQLVDYNGIGIDDNTVTTGTVQLWRNGVLLTDGLDYLFTYDSTNDVIRLTPAAGIWTNGSDYKIVLVNTAQGIRDQANNPLAPNRTGGQTSFNIRLSGMDFGDAPDPTYPSLLDNDGARHVVYRRLSVGRPRKP